MTTITITIETADPGAANILLNKIRMQNPDVRIVEATGPDPADPKKTKTYDFGTQDKTKQPDNFLKDSFGKKETNK